MTSEERARFERVMKKLKTCPPPHRTDMHRLAIETIQDLLSRVEQLEQQLATTETTAEGPDLRAASGGNA